MKTSNSEMGKPEYCSTYSRKYGNQEKNQSTPKLEYIKQMSNHMVQNMVNNSEFKTKLSPSLIKPVTHT